jgi:hypothetical protein
VEIETNVVFPLRQHHPCKVMHTFLFVFLSCFLSIPH